MSALTNVATKGEGSIKNDRRTRNGLFRTGGYKIEPLLTKW